MTSGSLEQISIKSNIINLISKDGPILLNTNKEIHLGSNQQITFDVGPVGSKDPKNVFRINSPRIELGVQPNPVDRLEAIPKSDQLIAILTQMLSIMNDLANNPDEVKTITGEIEQLQKQLYKIKSEISYTI
jgi:hypothetical protein